MSIPIAKVEAKEAPAAVGPYSQAVRIPYQEGVLLFVSGQIPLDPKTGHLIEGDIAVSTKRVLDNIGAILMEAESCFSKVVKVEIFLTDMSDFEAMNEVYQEYFDGPVKPARQAVQVAALPKGAPIEISCIALT